VTKAEVNCHPHGVVGLITPWNYPFLLPIGDAIPALLAGNAVIIKPSERTPLSAELGRRLLIEAGLDADLLALVHGAGELGAALIAHVDYMGFTGGTATGRKVAVASAERLIPFSLELGGKNPMIVARAAPLDRVVQGLLAGSFSNSGQTCIAIERVYVEDSIFEPLTARIVEAASRLKLGWSPSWDIDVGSLIHRDHAKKVMAHIDGAVRLGASVRSGGRLREDIGPAFVEPTVLTGVHDEMPIAKEETFGPVISVYPVRDLNEAVARANDSAYGLNATVWSGDAAAARSIGRRLETGSVAVNSTLMIYNTFDAPMGGVKLSGIGRRHAEQGILRYTQAQSIVSSFSAGGGYDAVLNLMRSEGWVKGLLEVLRWWRRIS
jgi:acyl-CoA reductase-like NAD-dependent aldehyde dehydrogenase